MSSSADNADVTEDLVYGGRVRVRQPARGYRVNVDTILLAASVQELRRGAHVIEAGCGVGAGLLIMAANAPHARFTGIERDPGFAAFASENVALNSASDRVDILEADALDPPAALGQADAILFNPPFDQPGEGRAPAEARRSAHIADSPLEDWIKTWSNRMASGATLTLIQRAHRLPEILSALEGRLGGIAIYPVRPHAAEPASRVLVRAVKGSRAPLALLPGLDLHPEQASSAKHTPAAEAILRGEQPIRLG